MWDLMMRQDYEKSHNGEREGHIRRDSKIAQYLSLGIWNGLNC